jgi:trans-aconitate methyltransferase
MNKGHWDARTYDQVSRLVQYRWGKQVIELRKWRGNEIVMDAGCGSGLLTKQLAKKVPRGMVYAVDIDPNMIKQAKNNLQFFDNVEIMKSSFTNIKLPRKIDVIFSNSALHWVKDHRKAFQNFWKMLKPMNSNNNIIDISISGNSNSYTAGGGQLLIQCGGHGNLRQTITILEQIINLHQFKEHFTDWKQPWYFAKSEDTNKLLQEIGYVNTEVYHSSGSIIFPNRQIYSKFVKTVVMKSYLDHLSQDNHRDNDKIDKLKTLFLKLFLDEVKKCSNKSDKRWFLDFVRLNIIAQRP